MKPEPVKKVPDILEEAVRRKLVVGFEEIDALFAQTPLPAQSDVMRVVENNKTEHPLVDELLARWASVKRLGRELDVRDGEVILGPPRSE